MSKRKRISREEQWIKEGRGSGKGANYKPWLTIQDVSSLGRSSRIKGNKINRQHEMFSDLERNYFYISEFSDCVVDIREQFPLLPKSETIVIANELGIKHPTNPKTNEPIVMTTDFLLTIDKDKRFIDVARTIKMKDELLKERVIEKFEIERVYWERRGIDWGIVTEEEIPKVMARNLSHIHNYYKLTQFDAFRNMNENQIEDLAIEFLHRIIQGNYSVREKALLFDKDTHMPLGSGLTLFYHLLSQKIIKIDMFKPINIDEQLVIKSIDERRMKKVKYG